jgi:hypothetical protein
MVASLTGQIMLHLHRPSNANEEAVANKEFWSTHRKINNTLLNMSLHLPAHLRLPAASSDPTSIYLNMTLQSAVICLHQAAIFKAEKSEDLEEVVEESKSRCLAAATELASIMMRIAHTDLSMVSLVMRNYDPAETSINMFSVECLHPLQSPPRSQNPRPSLESRS